jgi:hypothetical protein
VVVGMTFSMPQRSTRALRADARNLHELALYKYRH